jgi:hypothetical protein
MLVLLVLFGRGGIAGAVERWRRGELSAARLRASIEAGASAARARVVGSWQQAVAIGALVRDRGLPLVQRGLAQAAARWKKGNMAFGRALVTLVLVADRSITGLTGAVARWRRR